MPSDRCSYSAGPESIAPLLVAIMRPSSGVRLIEMSHHQTQIRSIDLPGVVFEWKPIKAVAEGIRIT
jgi:hypothetical protein